MDLVKIAEAMEIVSARKELASRKACLNKTASYAFRTFELLLNGIRLGWNSPSNADLEIYELSQFEDKVRILYRHAQIETGNEIPLLSDIGRETPYYEAEIKFALERLRKPYWERNERGVLVTRGLEI